MFEMSPPQWLVIWSVPAAVALHNLEEALWLPQWARAKAGRWHRPVSAWEFRFAVTILTIVAFLLGGLTQIYGRSSVWHYLLAGYALGQGLNVFVPHLVASIGGRTYMPGLLTGVFVVLPATTVLLYQSFVEKQLEVGRFLVLGPLVIVTLLLAIPVLFRVGRRLAHRSCYNGTDEAGSFPD